MRQNGLGDIHLPAEIDINIEINLIFRHIHELSMLGTACPGTVDKDINLPEPGETCLYCRFHIFFLGDIHFKGDTLAAGFFNQFYGFLCPFKIKIAADYLATFLRQDLTNFSAETYGTATAGYKRHFSFES